MLASSFFNTSNVWFGYIANAFFTVGALAAVAKLVQKYFTHHSSKELQRIEEELVNTKLDMDQKFDRILSQYKTNGGSSPKDQWNRLENKVDHLMQIEKQVDKIGQIMDRHLGYHEGLRAAHEDEE